MKKSFEQVPSFRDDLEMWETTKPTTMEEVLEIMRKEGLRSLSIHEVEAIVRNAKKSESSEPEREN
ncbi:MAG TPA: hypothetical protein VJH94_03190 [Candidatus Paceibacterota bacterium]